MSDLCDYYVYVYIDPRNFEEFYYGQGRGNRKEAHLLETNQETEKVKRITGIRNGGMEPIIKVIAGGLTQDQALLIESTLIWKFHRTLTNISSGHYAENFRPQNTLHLELKGFDYENGIYLLNVGEGGGHRSWRDCCQYGFMSAGQGKRYRDLIQEFRPGDIIAAYWSKKGYRGGYVGIGVVRESAVSVNSFMVGDKLLRELPLNEPNIFDNCNNPDMSEWILAIEWIKTVPMEERKWHTKAGLFSTPSTKASLEKQKATLDYLEAQFGVRFNELRGQTVALKSNAIHVGNGS
jgi:uncharacterized protein